MYRVLILLFLAIVTSAFAIDSSDTILQAKSISDKTVTLQWLPMKWVWQYKVFYDEASLLDSVDSKPLFDSEIVKKTELTISDLKPETEYVFFVHWLNNSGVEILKSLPVHVNTSKIQNFTLKNSPIAVSPKKIEISFTMPIDIKKTQIVLTNSETKKQVQIDHLETSADDLRVVLIFLKKELAPGVAHDLVMKKVSSNNGLELSPENRTNQKIVYLDTAQALPVPSNTSIIPEDTEAPVVVEKTFEEPVQIDALPRTWPEQNLLFLLIALSVAYILQKKLYKRA